MTTKIDLKRTLEICERATEGPWDTDGKPHWNKRGTGTYRCPVSANRHGTVATALHRCSRSDLPGAISHDALFIAHARTALPQYTDALEEAVGLLRDSPVEECPAPEPDKCGCYAAILGRFLSRFEDE